MSIIEKTASEKRYLTFPEVWELYGIGRKKITFLKVKGEKQWKGDI